VTRPRVPRSSRIIDLLSLVLVSAGGLLYVFAYLGMDDLRSRPHTEFVPHETELFERTREHARLTRTSRIGLGLCVAGVVVALSAAAHAHIIGRRSEAVPAQRQ
jgi:hypothetical protein